MDTGASLNYISVSFLAHNGLMDNVTPVTGERVQLGGTDTYVPISGRIRLSCTMGGVTAPLVFQVFDTQRVCIIGLESLVLSFLEVLGHRLRQVKESLSRRGVGPIPSLYLSSQVYPKEPGGRSVDLSTTRTALTEGQEIQVGTVVWL